MHRGLWILTAICAACFLLPLVFHFSIKRYALASLLSGLTAGVLSAALLAWSGVIAGEMFLLTGLIFAVAGIVIALGVGIPFNRKRNALPPEGIGGIVSRTFTRRIAAIEMVLTIVLAIALWKVLH